MTFVTNWSKQEIDTLHAMKGRGARFNDIAVALGRPYQSVTQKYLRAKNAYVVVSPYTGKPSMPKIPASRFEVRS